MAYATARALRDTYRMGTAAVSGGAPGQGRSPGAHGAVPRSARDTIHSEVA